MCVTQKLSTVEQPLLSFQVLAFIIQHTAQHTSSKVLFTIFCSHTRLGCPRTPPGSASPVTLDTKAQLMLGEKRNIYGNRFGFFWGGVHWAGLNAACSRTSWEVGKNSLGGISCMPYAMRHIYILWLKEWLEKHFSVEHNQSRKYRIVFSFVVLDYIAQQEAFVCLNDLDTDSAIDQKDVRILQNWRHRGCRDG